MEKRHCNMYEFDDESIAIEEILIEASAFNLRNEVYLNAMRLFHENNALTLLDAFHAAYDVLITNKLKEL